MMCTNLDNFDPEPVVKQTMALKAKLKLDGLSEKINILKKEFEKVS